MTSQPTTQRSVAPPRTVRGVTLLEMLVALALMGMLASALYMSLHIGFRANASAERALAPVRSATLALELMRRDLESALPPVGVLAGPFLGEEEVLSRTGEPSDMLAFYAAVDDSRDGGPAVRLVEFGLEEAEDGSATHFVRRETANLLAPTTPEPTVQTLSRNALAFEVLYFDGLDWVETWDSTARDNRLPAAVEVRLAIGPDAAGPDFGERYELVRLFSLPCAARPAEEE